MAESLGLVNGGVQDAAGRPLQEGLDGFGMEELPACTTAHGFTHPAGSCGGYYPQETRAH